MYVFCRFEWQSRGSAHVHALLWVDGAVDINNLDDKIEDLKKRICNYFDNFINTTTFGDINETKARVAEENPCARNPTQTMSGKIIKILLILYSNM